MISSIWNWADPGFFEPLWLLAGGTSLAVIAWLEIRSHFLRQAAVRAFAAAHLIATLVAHTAAWRRVLKVVLLVIATGLLFVALARPHLFYDWSDETRSGIDVLLAVDCSLSMQTEDVKPNRLDRAKLAIADFADHLPDDRLGLIAFAGDAFLECPLTLDHDAFLDSVRDLDTQTIPKPGTDIATAIEQASDALRSQPGNMKFLILISDGEDLEGRALNAARQAAHDGLRIFTVGVGTPEGDHIPERTDTIYVTYHHDLDGNEVTSRLDENTLRQIAEITGGAYVPLGATGDGLQQIYDRFIATLPRQNLEEKRQKIHIERFEWPLAAAIFLLMAEFVLSERVRAPTTISQESPRRTVRRSAQKGVAVGVPMFLALLAFAPAHGASLPETERAYQSGDFDTAAQGYEQAAEKDPLQPELQFNRGDAAYKQGDYSEAENAFLTALQTHDLALQEQSYYNLGNAQFQHGAIMLKANRTRTISLWEDSLHSYTCALQLKPGADTQHNYDVVKRKLDELLQQQPQQGGNQGSSGSGHSPSGSNGRQPSNGPQSGTSGANQNGGQGQPSGPGQNSENSTANGNDQQGGAQGKRANAPVQAYSGTRSQDLKDPQIRSRQDAENLLDSLKDGERRVSARTLNGDTASQPPPSGKDW